MDKETWEIIKITYKAEAKINDMQDRMRKGEVESKEMKKFWREIEEHFYDIIEHRRNRLIKAGAAPEVVDKIIKRMTDEFRNKSL